MSQANLFKNELESLILRWSQESDLTVGDLISTLEIVKTSVILGHMEEEETEPPLDLENDED